MANYKQIAASAQVKTGAGKLKGFTCSTTSSGTVTVYDTEDSDTNDPKILNTITVAAGTTYAAITDGIWFNKGLYVAIANAAEITVYFD